MSSKPVGFSQVTAARANNGKYTGIPAPFGGVGQTAAAARPPPWAEAQFLLRSSHHWAGITTVPKRSRNVSHRCCVTTASARFSVEVVPEVLCKADVVESALVGPSEACPASVCLALSVDIDKPIFNVCLSVR